MCRGLADPGRLFAALMRPVAANRLFGALCGFFLAVLEDLWLRVTPPYVASHLRPRSYASSSSRPSAEALPAPPPLPAVSFASQCPRVAFRRARSPLASASSLGLAPWLSWRSRPGSLRLHRLPSERSHPGSPRAVVPRSVRAVLLAPRLALAAVAPRLPAPALTRLCSRSLPPCSAPSRCLFASAPSLGLAPWPSRRSRRGSLRFALAPFSRCARASLRSRSRSNLALSVRARSPSQVAPLSPCSLPGRRARRPLGSLGAPCAMPWRVGRVPSSA